ncbi:MAG: hypothetical protein IJK31_02175 [Ruminococcus sp.]|nr:hypothetical protein [Ruminococcus sp.]
MKEKDTTPKADTSPAKDIEAADDEKLDIKKSVFEVNRELQAQRQREQEELERKAEEKRLAREKARQEAYDRKILEDRKELIKLKQGLIEDTEVVHDEAAEAVVRRTPWQKFRSFIYLNKWWLMLVLIFGSIGGFLLYNFLTKPKPDIVVLVICDDLKIGDNQKLEEYIESFSEDFNGNGKVLASVYYIQLSDNEYRNYANGTDNKLTTQLQSADSVIVIGGKRLMDIFTDVKTGQVDDVFMDMNELFPGNSHIKSGRFYLKGTKFAERIGLEDDDIPYDMFITIRKPADLLYSNEKDMQKTYDKDFPVLEKIIADLSEE